MNPMPMLSNHLHEILGEDNDLVFDFFLTFSRFEYALKAANYRYLSNGVVRPNWNVFNNQFSNAFDPRDDNIKDAFDYLNSEPPKIQTIEDDNLSWRENERRDLSDLAWCVKLVKTVRNNLFHGGKFPYHFDRDRNLLTSSLIIIAYLIKLDPEVERRYREMSNQQNWYIPPY